MSDGAARTAHTAATMDAPHPAPAGFPPATHWAAGSTLLLTGGGAGIGAALCRAFTAAGGDVISLGRSPAAEPDARDAPSAAGTPDGRPAPRVHSHLVELGDAAALNRTLDRVVHELRDGDRQLRYLVNNASLRRTRQLRDADRAHWREIFEVNLFAPMELCRVLVPLLADGGAVVNVSSGAARHLSPGTAAYAASQAALEAATTVLAGELAPRDVRVNTVAPGPTLTPGLERAVQRGESLDADTLATRIPLGRLGRAEEVAATVMFLLSPAAGFVTGQTLAANGGL
jgi:NAD(P)-dependent dehydrogenase (short-subunit alcohol dehydrogenase family)